MHIGQASCYFLIISSLLLDLVHFSRASGRNAANASAAANNTTSMPSTVLTSCKDKSWVLHNSKCYRVFSTFEYFSSASQICKENKGNLASILDSVENNLIQEIVSSNTRYTEAWIGLRIVPPSQEYLWIDNTKSSYWNWLFQRPNDEGKCVEIIPGGHWSNTLCYRKLQFVCKRDEVYEAPKDNKTKLIIMISLPLSCVVIMLVFISYLCFRSHEEMKSMRLEDKKTSQHFVDIVANNATVDAESSEIVQAYEKHLKERTKEVAIEEDKDDIYKERRKRAYSSSNGKEKMYKQVTFV